MTTDMLRTEEKLHSRLQELFGFRYQNKRSFNQFLVQEDASGVSNPSMPEWKEGEYTIFHTGDVWKGRDRYVWLQIKVELPMEWQDTKPDLIPVGVFDFGHTGGAYNSGFESMLYINGEPYQSVDTNHKEVFFKEEHFGRELTLTFRLWSGLEGGGVPREMEHQINDSFIGLLNHAVDDLYYTGDTVLRAVQVMAEEQPERSDLLCALDAAFLAVDWSDKGEVSFYESVKVANELLWKRINSMEKHSMITVSCVGHTHIDTAWLWRIKHTREKASRSFSTVLRLMELFPEYIFLHSQPQQYAYIKEDFPEIYSQIKERVKEGRWEIDGAMWVEPDCNLPSGESLTRQILIGTKFIREEFGKESEYLWLPDVFGYSWALPQILKKSGIDMFMTTKLTWNKYNRMPNDTFWWKGMDGSTVLAHFLTIPLPGQDISDDFYSCYNGELYPDTVTGSWKMYREKDIIKETLISYGYGDGGGGTTREMIERRQRMDKIPGLPHVKTSTAGSYFKRLKKACAESERPLATWDGEMYLEYHRGTYTSQAYIKKTNRQMEHLYRKAEWLTAMRGILNGDLKAAEQECLTEGWKIILTHQFHDIIPGSSIHEVYEDAKINYSKAKEIADSVIENACKNQTIDENVYSVLNSFTEKQSNLVLLPDLQKDYDVFTAEGEYVPTQKGHAGIWAYVKNVPAMGVKYLFLKEKTMDDYAEQPICNVIVEDEKGMFIHTPYYNLVLNEKGQIGSLYDKAQNRNVLEEGESGNILQLFEDKPLAFDAWELDMFYYQKMQEVGDLIDRQILENGPLRTVIRQEWKFSKSHIIQDMILYRNNRRIDFKTHVDWQETHKILKVSFPVNIRTTYATYDIQYGNIRRPNNSNTSWERAKFECVGHRWADLSEYGYGVSLLNDCKYGYDIHQNVMRLSLLKATTDPDYIADKGEHDFTYALYPHQGEFVAGGTVSAAFNLNQPLELMSGKIEISKDETGSSIGLSGGHVELDAFKKSEDGKSYVIRFHEYAGETSDVELCFGFDVRRICECDLMERPLELYQDCKVKKLIVRVSPYEIRTFLIQI